MNSRNKLAMFLLAPLLFAAGCAHLPKRESTGIERQSYTVRFVGYETTVEIKGTPEEVGKYMLQPRNYLNYETNRVKFEITSPKMFEQVGDTVGQTITFSGIKMSTIIILANYTPGREIWYFNTGEKGVLVCWKIFLEPFQGHTRMTFKYEDEVFAQGPQDMEENFRTGKLIDLGRDTMGQMFEMIIAKVQQHFDPSLKPEELLREGSRGKFVDPVYDAFLASIWINAPPEKVYEYLKGPGMKKHEAEYGSWMGRIFFTSDKGPFPSKINTDDINLELIGFPGLSTYAWTRDEYHNLELIGFPGISTYGVTKGGFHSTGFLMSQSRSFITKNQITIKRSRGGSELSINYLVSASRVVPTELYDLALLETNLPAPIDRFLLGVKQDLEGGSK